MPASKNILTVGSAVADALRVPTGYTAKVFVAWGDPIMPGGTPFIGDASESSLQQEKQFGEHNDGMHFFPLRADDRGHGGHDDDDDDDDGDYGKSRNDGKLKSQAGMLCVNNEYTHEEILFADAWSARVSIAKSASPRQGMACRSWRFVEGAALGP